MQPLDHHVCQEDICYYLDSLERDGMDHNRRSKKMARISRLNQLLLTLANEEFDQALATAEALVRNRLGLSDADDSREQSKQYAAELFPKSR